MRTTYLNYCKQGSNPNFNFEFASFTTLSDVLFSAQLTLNLFKCKTCHTDNSLCGPVLDVSSLLRNRMLDQSQLAPDLTWTCPELFWIRHIFVSYFTVYMKADRLK